MGFLAKLSKQGQNSLYWVRAMRRLSKKKDISELQAKYGATREKVFQLRLADEPALPLYFQVTAGQFNVFTQAMECDMSITMTTATFLNICHQRCMMRNHRTGHDEPATFSFWDALRFGLVEAVGEGSTQEVNSFVRIFDDLISELNQEYIEVRTQSNRPQ